MLGTLNAMLIGRSDSVSDSVALTLIVQKIRETEADQRAAMGQMARAIQQQRTEVKLLDRLNARLADTTAQATNALRLGQDDLARVECSIIAALEQEHNYKINVLTTLEAEIHQLRTGVETCHRALLDLRQGHLRARALRREQAIRLRLGGGLRNYAPSQDAHALIARVMDRHAIVLPQPMPPKPINLRRTASQVLARLRAQIQATTAPAS